MQKEVKGTECFIRFQGIELPPAAIEVVSKEIDKALMSFLARTGGMSGVKVEEFALPRQRGGGQRTEAEVLRRMPCDPGRRILPTLGGNAKIAPPKPIIIADSAEEYKAKLESISSPTPRDDMFRKPLRFTVKLDGIELPKAQADELALELQVAALRALAGLNLGAIRIRLPWGQWRGIWLERELERDTLRVSPPRVYEVPENGNGS
jgi:hypothetical protein